MSKLQGEFKSVFMTFGTISSILGIVSFLRKAYDVCAPSEIERLHGKALDKWCKNDGVRQSEAVHYRRDYKRMLDSFTGKEHNDLTRGEQELLKCLIEQFRENSSVFYSTC